MEPLKHECGVAMIRLLKPLEYYQEKYGTWMFALNKLYLMMEKQHNRGQEGAGMACVKLGGKPGHEYMFRERAEGKNAVTEIFGKANANFKNLKPKRAEKFSFQQFADLVHNKAWLYMTAIAVCTNFFNGFRYAVAGYMFDYCLHGNVTIEGLIINYTVFMAFGEVTCMIFGGVSPWFTRLVGSKRMAFFWAATLCLVLSVVFFFIPMNPSYIWVMIAIVILTSMGIGIYSPLMWSMYADVADYHTEHFGTSATGLIFSSGTMSQKFGTAISGSLIALFLGWAGANMITDKMGNTMIDPASVTDSVLTMVWSLFSLFPAVIAFLLMVLSWKFPIRK